MSQWGKRAAVLVVVCAAVVVAVVGGRMVVGDDRAASTDETGRADNGWRWESYQSIEVQVPADWSYGVTGSPPCRVDKPRPPYVGRPGGVRGVGCRDPYPPLAVRASYLWFGARRGPAAVQGTATGARMPGVRAPDHGWVEETRLLDGLNVTVFSDDEALRQRILNSARLIDGADANGCTPNHPLADHPQGGPTSAEGLASIGVVESIAVCKYAIAVRPEQHEYAARRRAALIASSTMSGDPAQAFVAAIARAPVGSGPDSPDCIDDYGSEIIVLKVRGSERNQEVLIRYDGCRFNGIHDGVTLRHLTAEVLRPLLVGVHRPSHYTGPVGDLVLGPRPKKG
ncbi:hypothetical protein FB561_2721 [Kribbella amoyensis]|uniref:Uncharacterized protein n=1 Tax=Kribbella amoyensis TaxID=996641 RepID=A0A561BRU5_9ACTN|nr:hypothetical protein [Kribbella amoyensis]TWD81605.1 hypothetical protein FB561_2721 [Kribbella amoyensis]